MVLNQSLLIQSKDNQMNDFSRKENAATLYFILISLCIFLMFYFPTIRVKHQRGKGLNYCISPSQSQGPCVDSQLCNQPIVMGILRQPSSRKQFVSRRKRTLEKGGRQLSVYTSMLQICCPKGFLFCHQFSFNTRLSINWGARSIPRFLGFQNFLYSYSGLTAEIIYAHILQISIQFH